MNKYYLDAVHRFGLNTDLPDYQPISEKVSMSEAERLFLLSEKKWNIDHDSLEVPPKETIEKIEEEKNEEL